LTKRNLQSASTHAGKRIGVRPLGACATPSTRFNFEENSNIIDISDLRDEVLVRINATIDDEVRDRKNMTDQVMPEWTL
jgi:hypothetical protein